MTPFTDLLDEDLRRIQHAVSMHYAMCVNQAVIGVPYGPALCEALPPKLRGLMITGDPRNRAERRKGHT